MVVPQLPEELLIQIFSCIPVVSRTIDFDEHSDNKWILKLLRSLSLASRAFHRMIAPFLYGTMVLYGDDDELRYFVRTLLARRDLAGLVKQVIFGCITPRREVEDTQRYDPIFAEMRTFLEEHHVEDDFGRDLTSDSRLASDDICFVIIFQLCPRIIGLDINLYNVAQNAFWMILQKRLEIQPSTVLSTSSILDTYLPCLESVSVHLYEMHEMFGSQVDMMSDMGVFLLIPTLKKLTCDYLTFFTRYNSRTRYYQEAEEMSGWLARHSHRQSNLRELHLLNCSSTADLMLKFIDLMPHLQVLHLAFTEPYVIASYKQMSEFLRKVTIPLRELRFDVVSPGPSIFYETMDDPPELIEDVNAAIEAIDYMEHTNRDKEWTSLANMTSLEIIGIPCEAVCDNLINQPHPEEPNSFLSQTLPFENLHTLELREYRKCSSPEIVRTALWNLMHDSRFHKLRRVELTATRALNQTRDAYVEPEPLPDYPREALHPGWKATRSIFWDTYQCRDAIVLIRKGPDDEICSSRSMPEKASQFRSRIPRRVPAPSTTSSVTDQNAESNSS
jgi:hypothetical protein